MWIATGVEVFERAGMERDRATALRDLAVVLSRRGDHERASEVVT